MKRSPVRKLAGLAAVVAVVAFVLLLIAAAAMVVQGGLTMESVRSELAERRTLRSDAVRGEVLVLARGTRMPAHAAAVASDPRASDPMHPSNDALFGRAPAERPIHDWLSAVRLARTQPGPAPPPEVLAVLGDVAPALDALGKALSRTTQDERGFLVAPGDKETRAELERAHAMLLAAACAESLSPSGDPVRGERLLEAAWTLGLGLPVGIDDAGPGDLLLAVLRQVRVEDPLEWSNRIALMDPQSRLVAAVEWDAASRLARLERTIERRKEVQPGWVPPAVQRLLGSIASKHDVVFASRISAAEAALARQVRALGPCDDPWILAGLNTGEMRSHWPVAGEVRLRTALASASLAQADAALTRHVLLRRHGLEPPRDACGTQALVERREGGSRIVVGWRVPGRDEPAASDRERPRNHSPRFRTWPAPSLPGPPLDPFAFEP